MIDAHIHIEQYDSDTIEQILKQLPEQQIEALIAVSMDLDSCKRTKRIATTYPGMVQPAYGFHPEQALPHADELASLLEWIQSQTSEEFIAIGEIGLPYYTRAKALERGETFDVKPYISLLDQLIGLAAQLAKPVVLHAVYEDALIACNLLEKHSVQRAHFHWFKGPEEAVTRMIKNGFYISFTPDILYEPEIQALASYYPVELVMAETDGPWPFEGSFKGRITHPEMICDVAEAWGQIHGYSLSQAKEKLTANTKRFYDL